MKRIALSFILVSIASWANPTANQDGLTGVNKTQSAQTLGKGRLQISAYSHVTNDERLLVDGLTTRNGFTERTQYFLIADNYFNLAYGITDRFDVALGIPDYYEEINNTWRPALKYDFGNLVNAYSPGGLKLLLKHRLFSSNEQPWGAAVILGASAPPFSRAGDGMVPRGGEFIPLKRTATGSHAFGTEAIETYFTGVITGDFSKLPSKLPLVWHLNGGVRKVGFQIGSDRDFDDVAWGSTAMEYLISSYFEVSGEFYHEARFNVIWDGEQFKSDPTTVALTAVAKTPIGLQFHAGALFGILNDGFSPDVEHRNANGQVLETFGLRGSVPLSLFAEIAWNGVIIDQDADKDGIKGKADKCPTEAEDMDGFQDEDGCPEPDNDRDGVLDASDRCPDRAEDKDGYQDEDGCPDVDNDADEITDLLDKCPMQPEDKDGFQDEDGCPDPDNDQDGILDEQDKCVLLPETKNGFEDEDGCPDEVIKKGVEIVLQGVLFQTGSAELTPESIPILDLLASQLIGAPGIHLEVQGHTDNVGSAAKNKKLSQRRAESVVAFLVDKGVAKENLKAIGFGSEKPVDNNKTAAGRALNRRVEMLRVE